MTTVREPAPTRRIIGVNGDPVAIANPFPVVLVNANGNPLTTATTSYGTVALDIHDADVHSRIINKIMHRHTAVTTMLTAATVAGTSYQIEVADATGFALGDHLHINTTSIEPTKPRINVISAPTGPATFTLDRRLDFAHAIGDTVIQCVVNMASAAGTMAAPIEYWVAPEPGEVWHLTRLLFEMTHSGAGDLGLFGNIDPLPNGVLLRARVNGQYSTFTNWKTNADIKSDMYDVEFAARSGGGGTHGTTGRGTFTNAGTVVRLDGDTNDRVELYVQDPLTGIINFTMKMQGHFEGAA